MPEFIPGLELNRLFFHEVVRPILTRYDPALPYAAARLGWGSEVLGYDTEMSTDHNWGPMLSLFLPEDRIDQAGAIRQALSAELPATFRGYPVFFAQSDGPYPVDHWVFPVTVKGFVKERLGYDPARSLTVADWLTFPSQRLLEITAGAVYHDGAGELTAVRQRFASYPHDVWLYLMAAGWQRIGQEEHLMPRAGIAGDELGAALIGARLVRDVMRLGFLLERKYAPYPKWFGTAFARLACAPDLSPLLWQAQRAATWQERNRAIAAACEMLVRRHNELGITDPLPATTRIWHERPFLAIHGEDFVAAFSARVTDPAVQALFARGVLGGIDQLSDNTDLLSDPDRWRSLRGLYDGG